MHYYLMVLFFPSPVFLKLDFNMTLNLLEETKPDIVNLSRYSRRPGTDAAEMVQIAVLEILLGGA